MRILLDASVILAALGSKTGGSMVVLKLAREGKLQAVVSETIIEEVKRNVAKTNSSSENLDELIISHNIEIFSPPRTENVDKYIEQTGEKDAHVVASAVELKVDLIITLDKKHLLSGKIKLKSPKIIPPGELLKRLVEKTGGR